MKRTALRMNEHAWKRGFTDGRLQKYANPYRSGTTERWSYCAGQIEGKAASSNAPNRNTLLTGTAQYDRHGHVSISGSGRQ